MAQVTPYLIPGVNKIWGGLSAIFGLASVLPTFYKSMDGILTGNESLTEQNFLWKGATNAENWFSKFNSSFSDSAQGGLANYEQMGSLVSDIFSQIYQQRAAASVAKWFKNTDLTTTEKELALRNLNGETYYPATHALWFYAPSGKAKCVDLWYNQQLAGRYKSHCFYRPYANVCKQLY